MRFGLAGRCLASLLALPLVSPVRTFADSEQTGYPELNLTPVHREFVLEGGSGARVERADSIDTAPSESNSPAHKPNITPVRSLRYVVERVVEWQALLNTWHKIPDVFDGKTRAQEIVWGSALDWSFLVANVTALVCLDIFLLRGIGNSFKAHVGRGVIWLLVAAIYAASVLAMNSPMAAKQWVIGYIIEWMLSLDNILIFHVVFKSYRTPEAMQPKALIAGIGGAMFFRCLFFLGLSWLISVFRVLRFCFGVHLIVSGVQVVRGDDDDCDPETFASVRWLTVLLNGRLDRKYCAEGKLIRYDASDARYKLTMLAFIVLLVEVTDILFACDSVSAKAGLITNVYINLSSSAIAMFALRSFFFVVQALIDAFVLLKYGLCFVLVFVGVELCVSPWTDVPPQIGVMVILTVFATCVVGSLIINMRTDRPASDSPVEAPAAG